MPGDIHSFDDSADDESLAFGTARGKENVEVRLAVFPTFELVENSIFERLWVVGWEGCKGMVGGV